MGKLLHLKSKTFMGLFVSYTLMLVVLLAIVLASAWGNALRDAHARTEAFNAKVAAELSDQLNAQVLEIAKLALTLNQMPWVHKLYPETANFDAEYTLKRRMEITREFGLYTGVNPIVERMALIFPYRDTCIASNIWTDTHTYFSKIGIPQSEQAGVLQAISETREISGLPAMEAAVPGSAIVLCTPVEQITKPRAYVCYFISAHKLAESIRRQMPDNMTGFALLGAERSEILRVAGHAAGEPAAVIARVSPFLDWTYEYSFSGSPLGFSPAGEAGQLLADYGPVFALGFVLSYVLSLFTYRPIGTLLAKVRAQVGKEPHKKAGGDYRFIGDCIELLAADNEKMKLYTSEYDKMMRVNMINRLLQGYFNLEEAKEQLVRFGIPFDDRDYFHVYLIVDSPDSPATADRLMRLKNLAERITGCRYAVSDTLNNEMVLIAAFSSAAEAAEKNSILLDSIHSHNGAHHGPAVFSGTIHKGIIGVSISYQQAREKCNHLYKCGSSRYYYPLEWEKQFITGLRAGTLPTVLNIIAEIKKENERRLHTGEINENSILKLTSLIVDTLCRVIGELNCGDLPFTDELEMLFSQNNPDECWRCIEHICGMICDQTAAPEKGEKSCAGQEVLEFVNANFADQDLSLKMLEDRFFMSIQTINRIVKYYAGCTFYAYLTRLRMEKAKELLVSSGESVLSIAEKVGYSNDFSFKRAFMRYTGVRPREYALNHKINAARL